MNKLLVLFKEHKNDRVAGELSCGYRNRPVGDI